MNANVLSGTPRGISANCPYILFIFNDYESLGGNQSLRALFSASLDDKNRPHSLAMRSRGAKRDSSSVLYGYQ